MKSAAILIFLLALPGCASFTMARDYEFSRTDHIQPNEYAKLRMLSGDARLVRQARADADGGVQICAETQADAISGFGTEGSVTGGYSGATLGFTDKAGTQLTVTNTRGQISDLVRQLSWQYCNALMNNWISQATYLQEMETMSALAFKAAGSGTGTGTGTGGSGGADGATGGGAVPVVTKPAAAAAPAPTVKK